MSRIHSVLQRAFVSLSLAAGLLGLAVPASATASGSPSGDGASSRPVDAKGKGTGCRVASATGAARFFGAAALLTGRRTGSGAICTGACATIVSSSGFGAS